MGKRFEQFLNERDEWDAFEKKRLSALLLEVLREERDVSNQEILDVLVKVAGTSLTMTPAFYKALAARGEPGWLATHGNRAIQSKEPKHRKEGIRWLLHGRPGNAVTEVDLKSLEILLADKDRDVESLAASTVIPRYLQDAPDQVLPAALKIASRMKGVQKLTVLASLEAAWGARGAGEVYALQVAALRDPKSRVQFSSLLIQQIKTYPPSAHGVEEGWERVAEPAIVGVLSGEWKRAKVQDGILLSIAGILLALRPSPAMRRRAEEIVKQTLEHADAAFSPLLVAARPGESLKSRILTVWQSYPQWLKSQLDTISRGTGAKVWTAEIKKAREMLEQLQTSKIEATPIEDETDIFKRKAMEFAQREGA
jgi:hypothetical protein